MSAAASSGGVGISGNGRSGSSSSVAAAVLSKLWMSLDTAYFSSIPPTHDLLRMLERLKEKPISIEKKDSPESNTDLPADAFAVLSDGELFEMKFEVGSDSGDKTPLDGTKLEDTTRRTIVVNFAASSPHDDGERWDSTVPKLLYDSRPGREWIMLPPSLPSSCSTKEGPLSVNCLDVIRVEAMKDRKVDRKKITVDGGEVAALKALLADIETRKLKLLSPVLDKIQQDQKERPNRQVWFDADKALLKAYETCPPSSVHSGTQLPPATRLSSRKSISSRGGGATLELPPLDEAFLATLGRALRDGEEVPAHPDGPDAEVDLCCSICGDGDVDDDNAILICDGCHFACHQKCYGVPSIPEQEWFCRTCSVFPRDASNRPVGERPTCVLCGRDSEFVGGGLMKPAVLSMPGKVAGARAADPILPASTPSPTTPTNSNIPTAASGSLGAWAHVKCAVWIRECSIDNPTTVMEPIRAVIHPSRRDLLCGICKSRVGAKVQCAFGKCQNFYHASCAARYGLVTEGTGGNAAWVIYCPRHSRQQQKQGNALLARLKAWRKSEHFTRLSHDKFLESVDRGFDPGTCQFAPFDPRLVTAAGFGQDTGDPSSIFQWQFDSEEASIRQLLEPVERLCSNEISRALLPPIIRDGRGDCPLLYPSQQAGTAAITNTAGTTTTGSVGAYGMTVTAPRNSTGSMNRNGEYTGVLYPDKIAVETAEQLRSQTHAASICGRCNECLMRADGAELSSSSYGKGMDKLVACQNCGLTVHWRCFLRPGLPPLNVLDYDDPKFTSAMYHCPYPVTSRNEEEGTFLCERCKYINEFGKARYGIKSDTAEEALGEDSTAEHSAIDAGSSEGSVKFSDTYCILCQQLGGLLVRVENPEERQWDPHGFWVHPRCVYWLLPTQSLSLNMTTTPIDINSHALIKSIPKDAHFSLCWICGQRSGCTVKCAKPGCIRRFHVSCGWYTGCHFIIKSSSGVVLAGSACRPRSGGSTASGGQNPAIDKQVLEALRNERAPLKRYAYCSSHRPPRLTGRKISNAVTEEPRMLSLPHYESPLHMQYANVVRARVNTTNLFVPINPEAGITADQRKKRKLSSNAALRTPKKSAKRKAKRRKLKKDSQESPVLAGSIITRDGITELVDADDWEGSCPKCGVPWDPNDSGQLIGCDQCDEWYHMACVGLISAPEGKWFCPNCTRTKTPSRKQG